MTAYCTMLEQKNLNARHLHLPEELQLAISNSREAVSYEFYKKYKDIYSSKKLRVKYCCLSCGAMHLSDFKHLNKRKIVKEAYCPKCVMKVSSADEGWRKSNSEAQLKIQGTPEQIAKNSAGVKKFWSENPERLAQMTASVKRAYASKSDSEKLKNFMGWNGRGISGEYFSKWGWIVFDSSYELSTIEAFEKNEQVANVRRGPVIHYEFEGMTRLYHIDFEVSFIDGKKWWVEVKSGYVAKNVDRIDKLKAKLSGALEMVRQGHADKIVMITEKNSQEILGRKMPRGTDRKTLFKLLWSKIIFSNPHDEEKYKCQD